MMSGIPLPQQFTQEPGGIQGAYNALQESSAKAKYAPYQAYADAYLKNQQAQWLPYQYKMQALTNPLLLLAAQNNKPLQEQINKMMADPMQGVGNSSVNIPQPGQGGIANVFKNALLSKLGLGGDQQSGQQSGAANPMATMGGGDQTQAPNAMTDMSGAPNPAASGTGSAMVPSTQGGMSGATAHIMAPYNTQVVDPGKSYRDPVTGQVISAPTARTATSLQTSITAAKRVIPQLQRIATDAAPFMTLGGEADTLYQRGKNWAFGGKSELPSQYAAFQSELKAAPESLVKAYGLNPTNETIERMAAVIEPYRGETADTYQNRILNTLENIKNEQEKQGEGQLYGGIPVGPETGTSGKSGNTGNSPNQWSMNKAPINADDPAILGQAAPPGTKWMVRPDGLQVAVHKSRMNEAKKLNYRGING